MHGTIAIGVSDSGTSAAALTWGVRRAARSDAAVVLIHVVDDESAPVDAASVERGLADDLRTARTMSPGSDVVGRRLRGSVMWRLVAESDDYGVIVVGTNRTGFIHVAVYGSATLALAATAACPVVVVPPLPPADAASGVVVGADGSTAGLAALDFAAAEAAETGQPLIAVMVTAGGTGPGSDDAAGVDPLLRVLGDRATAMHPALPVRLLLLHGSPAEVLVGASAGARLLVLGDSRTGSAEPAALGVVAHDALLNNRVPTAIVHAADSSSAGPERRRAAWMRSMRAVRSDAPVPIP